LANYGKPIRLHRVLGAGPTIVVAFDHPLVHGPIPGTGDPAAQIQSFIEANVDSILVNFGAIQHFAKATFKNAHPGLIARLDWTTALGSATGIPATDFKSCLVAHPEDALRQGADAVITFLIVGSGNAEFEKSEIRRVGAVARECERVGIPLVVESLARGPQVENPSDPNWLKLHSRIAAELGADVIKTEYSGDPASMRTVVEACPIPILVLGGSRTGSDADVLKVVNAIAQSGAAGVFFGRNVFQAEDMPALLQKVHATLSASQVQRKRP